MSHMISGVASSLMTQMMFGARSNSTSAKKATKAFQTIDSEEELSTSQTQLKQAVATLTAADGLPSSDVGSTIERIELQGSGAASSQGSADGLAGQKGSLYNAGVATGSSGVSTAVLSNSSLKSLGSLGNQTPSNGGPGKVVNVLM